MCFMFYVESNQETSRVLVELLYLRAWICGATDVGSDPAAG